ncbi:MAG TPA: helix-turn-helix domain-containing protein [Terrimesophilobacter sp.]|nr:helix-turn-helix domain-containing protein [Terrimesophilobacter sp.]
MSSTAANIPSMRFLTLADVAEVLNLTVAEVSALVHSRELPAIRMGATGPWRVEDSVLESFIDTRYEEARREGQWNQAEFANVTEIAFGID